jgi:hypothetical protein
MMGGDSDIEFTNRRSIEAEPSHDGDVQILGYGDRPTIVELEAILKNPGDIVVETKADGSLSALYIGEFTFPVSVERVRRIGQLLRNSSKLDVTEFGTSEAKAFLLLYGAQLNLVLIKTLREFIKDKLTK